MAQDESTKEDYIEIKIPQQEETVKKPQDKGTVTTTKKAAKKKSTTRKKPITPKKNKTAEKKSTTRKKPKKTSQPNNNWLWIILLIIGLAVIGTVIYLSLNDNAEGKEKQTEEEGIVAALVNNKPIYEKDIDALYDSLPPNVQLQVDKEEILDQLIDQELLLQEAEKNDIEATEEEVDAYTQELLNFYGMNEAQLDEALAVQGLTREDYEEETAKQIVVTKLINQSVLRNIVVTDEEIETHYETNKEEFQIDETATVRHVLIGAEENETEEELVQRAENIESMLAEDFNNFCELVSNYSEDQASIASCGEYYVARNGQYVEAFENAAMEMEINETRLVKTNFGIHLMWKVAHNPAGTLPIQNVQERIEQTLRQQKTSTAVQAYLDKLYDEATIEKYPASGKLETEETTPKTPQEEEEQEEDMQVTKEPTKPVREGTFGECLKDAGAKMYGVSWSPDVEEQLEMLGEAKEKITYVDCDEATGEEADVCTDINVYPTWVIDGEMIKGKQTINALSKATNCNT